MYQYDEYDQALVSERVAQFRDQIARRLDGELRRGVPPLRLQNGLYPAEARLHAARWRFLRHPLVATSCAPWRVVRLRPRLQALHHAAEHPGSTGSNWNRSAISSNTSPALDHTIQTSGNFVRNITTEAFAGSPRTNR